MKKPIVILLLLTLLFSLLPAHPTQAVEQNGEGITLLYSSVDGIALQAQTSFDDLEINTRGIDGELFSEITLDGWSSLDLPGEPMLPSGTGIIGVPFGTELSLEIDAGPSKVIQLEAPLMPGTTQILQQELSPEFSSDPFQTKFDFIIQPDNQIYAADTPYPQALAKIVSDGVLRDQRMLSIAFYPLQYHPTSNTLTFFERVTVRVKFSNTSLQATIDMDISGSPYNALLSETMLNFDSAQSWRLPAAQANAYNIALQADEKSLHSAASWQPPALSWRITTDGSGMFALTYSDLDGAGVLSGNPNPKYFSIFHQGIEIAIEVVGEEDEVFDIQDLILFYAPKFQSKYTQFDAFFLTINDTPGKRLENRTSIASASFAALSYTEETRYENNLNYRTFLKGNDDLERFIGEFIYATTSNLKYIDLPFEINSIAGEIAELSLQVLGYNYSLTINPDHHIKVYLNGEYAGESYWDGDNWLNLTLNVTGKLQEGSNTLRLELPNDLGMVSEVVFLDWFSINYMRATLAVANRLEFTYNQAGTWKFNLEGFTQNETVNLRVWDVSDTRNPVAISDFEIIFNGAEYMLAFGDDIQTEKTYLATDLGSAQSVSEFVADNTSDLRNPLVDPEMIIISHANFMLEAERLAGYRRSTGLEALAVDVQDVYDEFAYGVQGVNAIKDYLAFALDQWNTQYILLLGDGHYDPKNYLGFGRTNYVPAFLAFADPWIGETAADNRYVTLVGDDLLPDIMLGRLTVNSISEAQRVVNKIISYEQPTDPGTWMNRILSVADDADGGGNFPQIAENLFGDLKPENYALNMVHYLVTHTDPTAARASIVDHMNNGNVLVNYIGHGSYTVWADEPLFSRAQVALLNNYNSLSINLTMTCTDGFFHDPSNNFASYEGLAETVTRSTEAGAIASWSPTGMGIVTGHDYLNRGFLRAFFDLGASTVGEATLAGKLELWASGTNQDLLDTYTLFGDPALRIARVFNAISDNYEVLEDTTLSVSAANGVITNDINPKGLPLTAVLQSTSSHGVLSFAADGSFVYTPEADFFGTDSFEYTLFDGSSHSNSATVTILVRAVNDPPVAFDQEVLTSQNSPVAIILEAKDDGGSGPYYLMAETEAVGVISAEGLVLSIVTQPVNGNLTGTPPNLTYTPSGDYVGTDQFTFKANDGEFNSNTALVKIFILETSISPVARDDEYEMLADSTLQISVPGVLENDLSQNGEPLRAELISSTSQGMLTLFEDGSIIYQAEAGFTGSVSFIYRAKAGILQSNQALVTINVKPLLKIFLPIILR